MRKHTQRLTVALTVLATLGLAAHAEAALIFSTTLSARTVNTTTDTANDINWVLDEPQAVTSVGSTISSDEDLFAASVGSGIRVDEQMQNGDALLEFDFTTNLGFTLEEVSLGFRRLLGNGSDYTSGNPNTRNLQWTVRILDSGDNTVGSLSNETIGLSQSLVIDSATGSISLASSTTYTAQIDLGPGNNSFFVGILDPSSSRDAIEFYGTVIPEPASLALVGAAGVLMLPRRRRSA